MVSDMLPIKPQENVDWISLRAECTASRAIECLRMRIESDVETANKKNLAGGGFRVESNASEFNNGFIVSKDNTGLVIEFTDYEDKGIVLIQDHNQKIVTRIELQWREESATCEFLNRTKPISVWQISQMVLGPIFFPSQ